MKINKDKIINIVTILLIIVVSLIMFYVINEVQKNAMEECLRLYGNCSNTLLGYTQRIE